MLCGLFWIVVPLRDVPLDPHAPALAEHHPLEAVFVLAPGHPLPPVMDLLASHPALGNAQTTALTSGETRIHTTPDGPIPGEELTKVATEVLTRPGLRFVQAPAQRTWRSPDLARGAALFGMGVLVALQRFRAHTVLFAAPLLLGVGVASWALAPLHPFALLLTPLAVALGLAVRAGNTARPWAMMLGLLSALTLALTGTPALLHAGVLVGIAVCAGAFIPGPATHAQTPLQRRAFWFPLAALMLGIATVLAPAPAPVELLDPVPHTATVHLETPDDAASIRQQLNALGLGSIDEHPDIRALVVPLAAPWVAPFFTDTLDAIAPNAQWSGPQGSPLTPPWIPLGVWTGVAALLLLSRSRSTREAASGLPLLLAALLPLLYGVASGTPTVFAIGIALVPAIGTLFLLHPHRSDLFITLAGVWLPLFHIGVFAPTAWYPPHEGVAGITRLGLAGLALMLLAPLAIDMAAHIRAGWPGPRLSRWLPRAAWTAVLFVHLDVLTLLLTGFQPPPSDDTPLAQAPLHDLGAVVELGPHQRVRGHGVFVLFTDGDPYETGFAAGRLAEPLRQRLEEELFDAFERNVPYLAARWLITRGASLVGMGLDGALHPNHRVELRGDVDAAAERYAFAGASYTRKVYYHAIHDIGQALVDTPLLGCTGFVAGPSATPDGHWRLARAFDFDGGVAFDRDKVLRVHRPTTGIPFLSVSFAGIVGAVSGVNEAGIAVVINASGSDHAPKVGTPMTLIVREVLQHAHTLDEAEEILRARSGFVSENVLIVDAEGNRAALFEVSPSQVVRIDVDGTLGMSNHFRSEPFAEHAHNLERMAELTTVPRLARTEALVTAHQGHIDQGTAADILEDRDALDGTALPRGHRHALNADIATHGVVIDATTRSLWVSVYPNLSGGWVSLSLEQALEGKRVPVRVRGAESDAWRAVEIRRARELLRAARRHRGTTALHLATRAQQLWPDHPEALLERGLREISHGNAEEGRRLLEAARQAPVEYARDQRTLDAHLGPE